MNFVKKMNELFVWFILLLVYVFGLGVSFVMKALISKRLAEGDSYWIQGDGNMSEKINTEGY